VSAPFWNDRALRGGIYIASTRPEHCEQLEKLQQTVFPTLASEELLRAEHYHRHLEIFPEGQFVALDQGRVVGMTSTLRLAGQTAESPHTFAEVVDGGWFTSHDPTGDWLYGADVGTHPDYRGKGIGRGLYAARQHTVRQLGLKGQLTVGMLQGLSRRSDGCGPEQHYEEVVAGKVFDPTVSVQMKIGFTPAGLIRDYVNDPVCLNCGARLVLRADREVHAAWANDAPENSQAAS